MYDALNYRKRFSMPMRDELELLERGNSWFSWDAGYVRTPCPVCVRLALPVLISPPVRATHGFLSDRPCALLARPIGLLVV